MSDSYIKVTESFIKTFLTPLSNVVDKAPFLIKDSTISTCCKSPNGELTVSFSTPIDTNVDDKTINIPDIVKFKNLLDRSTILEDNDKLVINNNKLSYTSSKWRFKYHLLDSSLMKFKKLKSDVIDNFQTKLSFILEPQVLIDIVKLKSFHKNKVEKVYFKIIDGKIYACLTDETIASTDELSVMVRDKYELNGETTENVIKFDIIKLLSQHRGVPFKIKCSDHAVLVQTKWDNVDIKYITSKLRQ
jgi:hypothetical protein